LHGVYLRNLRLPADVIVLSVKRGGQMIISHGYTRLRRNDIVTFVGSIESLDNVSLRFGR
jgi:Trk K+ transport system NAD-binding subunit